MTTTHTFQGLNPESRPSSRVLNPPGGSSSNIFGGSDNWSQQQQQRTQNNSDSMSRVKTCDVGQDHQTGATGPKRTPQTPDGALEVPQGSYQFLRNDNTPTNNSPLLKSQYRVPHFLGRKCTSHSNTFLNLFGDCNIQRRNMFRKVNNGGDDSFTRVFGQTSLIESRQATSPVLADPGAGSVCCQSEAVPADSLSHLNNSSIYKIAVKDSKVFEGRRVMSDTEAKKFASKSGLNPITSQLYEQMKAKHENLVKPSLDQQPSTAMSCESISSKAVTESSLHLGPNLTSSADTITQTEKLKSTPSASVRYQQSSYIFDAGANEPKEVRSTRVTQPPGGKSTKLW